MAILILLVCIAFGDTSRNLIDVVHVDMIEYHHCYTQKKCEPLFSQVIFWNYYDDELRAVGYLMIDDKNFQTAIPTKVGGLYKVRKPYNNTYIIVVSKFYKESWSQDDPERISNATHWRNKVKPNIFANIKERVVDDE